MSEPGGNEPSKGAELVIEESDAAQRANEVAVEAPVERPPSLGGALAGGLGGALLGAVIWWGLMRVSGYELGLVAIGVGVLAGLGVVKLGGRGQSMQIIGAVCGLLGILLGRVLYYYFGFDAAIVAELVKTGEMTAEDAYASIAVAREMGALNIGMFFKESMGAIDLLMYAIGMFEGWRIPRSQT